MRKNKILFFLSIFLIFSIRTISQDIKIKTEGNFRSAEQIFDTDTSLTFSEQNSIGQDSKIIDSIPESYDNRNLDEMLKIATNINSLIDKMVAELIEMKSKKTDGSVIRSREKTIFILKKEKKIIDLTIKKYQLNNQTGELESKQKRLQIYLLISIIGISILSLGVIIFLQRRSIKIRDREIARQLESISQKNTYLEHAAKIIRHDMHSGINTYIPRGVSSLERRLNSETISGLKLESPLKMIKEGLNHTQKVYKGVYEFTNLVKKDAKLSTEPSDLKQILIDYLSNTSYISQVRISDLPTINVNQSLFCTAVDNLIRNGLKYNDNDTKRVEIYMEEDLMIIQDNGRGMTQEEFEHLSQPYIRREGQMESGSGLGLNICVAILKEHGFELTCEKNETGTKMKIKIR